MKIPLPTKVLIAIESLKWTLPSPIVLQYEPLDRLPLSGSSPSSMFENIHSTLQEFTSLQQTDGRFTTPRHQHYAILSLALLCLGNHYPSQAHNLVTPLSWSEDTYFGFDSSAHYFHKASTDVLAAASYTHSLVHRYECLEYGEYGLTGYSNANFWTKAALQYNQRYILASSNTDTNTLPLAFIQRQILNCSKENSEVAEKWCQVHASKDSSWDPRALHQLCAEIVQQQEQDQQQQVHPLHTFAQDAATVELKTLLLHCLDQAGFDFTRHGHGHQIQSDLALQCANKLSSAHVDAFTTNGYVLVRRMMVHKNDDNDDAQEEKESIAAGLACRFLDSPACCIMERDDNRILSQQGDSVYIYISTKDDDLDISTLIPFLSKTSAYYGGGSLSFGDAIVLRENLCHSGQKDLGLHHSKDWIQVVACDDVQDPNVSYIDSLHGLRGKCPTSVVQWSKGTIHKTF